MLLAKSVALPNDSSMPSEMGQRYHPALALLLCLFRAGDVLQGRIDVVFAVDL